MRRTLVVLVAVVALAALPAAARGCPRASLPDIESQVMCLVCGVPLGLADSPQADRERSYINRLIARCESASEIKRALVAQYGPRVLALPKDRGFGAAAYIAPPLIVLLSVGAAAAAVRWWTRKREADPTAAPPALSRADHRRLDAEMARWER